MSTAMEGWRMDHDEEWARTEALMDRANELSGGEPDLAVGMLVLVAACLAPSEAALVRAAQQAWALTHSKLRSH